MKKEKNLFIFVGKEKLHTFVGHRKTLQRIYYSKKKLYLGIKQCWGDFETYEKNENTTNIGNVLKKPKINVKKKFISII